MKHSEKGIKHDKQKLRYDLISPTALKGLVQVLTYGATKYPDRNWEKGVDWNRYFAGLMRHAWAFWEGEDIDTESGFYHIDHVQTCAHFLSHYKVYKKEFDNRPGKRKTITKRR